MRVNKFLALLLTFMPTLVMGAAGDVIKSTTPEGVTLTFVVTSESPKTCQVGQGTLSPYDPYALGKHGGDITIPDQVRGYAVTAIADYAFYGWTDLTSAVIPSSVTNIGYKAFASCTGLTGIEIPQGVTNISPGAFAGCPNSTSIVVDEANTVYDSRQDCNAIILTATNTLVAGCAATVIPDDVTAIADEAFYGISGLTAVYIPASVTSIGNNAFAYCPDITSIIVDEANTVYDSRQDCDAIVHTATGQLVAGCMSTVVPDGVTTVADRAFAGAAYLKSIVIPEGVVSVGSYAFDRCDSLQSVSIASTVTTLGTRAFNACNAIGVVVSNVQSPSPIADNTFTSRVYANATLQVPPSSADTYKATAGWKKFASIIQTELVFTGESGIIFAGTTARLDVGINNGASAINGYQFDLVLPDGISLAYDDGAEDFVYELSDRYARKRDMTVTVRQLAGNYYRCLCYSLTSQPILGTEGAVLSLGIEITGDLDDGSHDAQVINISCSHVDGSSISASDVTVPLQVSNFQLGDVNHDGSVNVADVMLIVNRILDNDVPVFFEECADMNQDGKIDVADVMLVVTKVMSADTGQSVAPFGQNAVSVSSYGTDVVIGIGDASSYTAFQMDVILPEGALVQDAMSGLSTTQGHVLQVSQRADGRYRIMVYAMDGSSLVDGGDLVRLSVVGCDASEVRLDGILFTNNDFQTIPFAHTQSTDAVTSVPDTKTAADALYNIQGQRVSAGQPGVYFTKGKKYVITK